jgi:hypothetical protein
MKRACTALVAAAVLGAAVAPAAAQEGPPPTATVSPVRAGARPATLTLKLHYEMVCGNPGRGPLVVTLPHAMRVPARIPRAAVLLQGKLPPRVSVAGHVVTVGVPPPPAVTCLSITMGTLTTTFTRAALLGNPVRTGAYAVRARIGAHAFTARLAIGR